MKKGEADKVRLDHILQAIDFIVDKTKNIIEDEFYRNDILKYALLKQIEIMGEAANFLSSEMQLKYNDIEWLKMISTRHYYVHAYFNINWVMVWETIQNDIIPLKNKIEKIYIDLTNASPNK